MCQKVNDTQTYTCTHTHTHMHTYTKKKKRRKKRGRERKKSINKKEVDIWQAAPHAEMMLPQRKPEQHKTATTREIITNGNKHRNDLTLISIPCKKE